MTHQEKLREEIAAAAHEMWAHWMRHYFTLENPNMEYERWKRLIDMPYEQLGEKNKESDRSVSGPILAIVERERREALSSVKQAVFKAAEDSEGETNLACIKNMLDAARAAAKVNE